jgi:hypothetical protein
MPLRPRGQAAWRCPTAGRRNRSHHFRLYILIPGGCQAGAGSFVASWSLGFALSAPPLPELTAYRRNVLQATAGARSFWPGCGNMYLGFVCGIPGSFVDFVGSFVDFLGFGGFVRGFVRRKTAEMYRYTPHKHR